jgi:DNA recombination protein RmuC
MADPTIFEYAAGKKICLASPTVLLPMLRAVAAGWKAERTEENARRVHDAGLQLFDRFVIVMEHIGGVGKSLEQAVSKYNSAIRSIDSRLWPKGEELQRMVGSGKDLGSLEQIETTPTESTRFRLTMQDEEGRDEQESPPEPRLISS